MNLSQLSLSTQPFYVMELVKAADELVSQGRSIIHLSIGEPDFGIPPLVKKAFTDAIGEGKTGYTSAMGIWPLREAISHFYAEKFNAVVPAKNIVITAGASSALLFACLALIERNDRVILTDPGYPCNKTFVQTAGGGVSYVKPPASQGYQPVLADIIEIWDEKTKGALLASPANPTGTRINNSDLQSIANWIESKDGFLIVDEIYQSLTYHDKPTSVLQVCDIQQKPLCVVNSFSKYFAMTGLRLGWLVVPDSLLPAIEKFSQNLSICPNTPTQWAALACFNKDTLELCEQRRQTFEKRLDFMVTNLPNCGFDLDTQPDSAFYVYTTAPAASSDYAHHLLKKAGVCVVPGIDFSASYGHQTIRLSYANSLDNIEKALEAIYQFNQQAGYIR